ncbi:ubiquitin carboxyl-terminal hydrolase 2-like protein [Tanacetum coccineum]|uniref:Ubiquitin carboxyl-terminal hydrolase 2-like protein n=1 Tax=Tanacetum coccineum TaxID=301880 RepID=A0ABQ5B4M3_9ASTR
MPILKYRSYVDSSKGGTFCCSPEGMAPEIQNGGGDSKRLSMGKKFRKASAKSARKEEFLTQDGVPPISFTGLCFQRPTQAPMRKKCDQVRLPTIPNSHAAQHAKEFRHPLALQYADPKLRWCFPCNALIPVQNFAENGEEKDSLSEFVKILKTHSSSLSVTRVVLQNLLAMDKLWEHLLELDGLVGPFTMSLKNLFIETSPSAGVRYVVNPSSLLDCVCMKSPQFKGFRQHDSHELLRCLLDGLSTEESCVIKRSQDGNSTLKHASTFVDNIFGGQISSTVSCLECGHASVVYEPYLDLSLPLPAKKVPPKTTALVSRSKKQKPPPKMQGRELIGRSSNIYGESHYDYRNLTVCDSLVIRTLNNCDVLDSTGHRNGSGLLNGIKHDDTIPIQKDQDVCFMFGIYHDLAAKSSCWYFIVVTIRYRSGYDIRNMGWLTLNRLAYDTRYEPSDFDTFGCLYDDPRVYAGPTVRLKLSDFDAFECLYDDPRVYAGPTGIPFLHWF